MGKNRYRNSIGDEMKMSVIFEKMDKRWELLVEWILAVISGICVTFLGGYDNIIKMLIVMVIADFITGLMKGSKNHSLKSAISYLGIQKKVMIFIVVAVAAKIDEFLGMGTPLRTIFIFFYIANEGVSFIENVSEFIPVPKQLAKFFDELKDKVDDDDTTKI